MDRPNYFMQNKINELSKYVIYKITLYTKKHIFISPLENIKLTANLVSEIEKHSQIRWLIDYNFCVFRLKVNHN